MGFPELRVLGRGLLVSAMAAVLAVLCWMSASDRMIANSAHPGKIYFGGSAAAHVAFDELARNRPRSALERARWAVRTAPVDPSSTSALASTFLALGQFDNAYAAFEIAGSLGWRDIPTQLYWLAQAIAIGDVDIASQRLDALLRLNVDNDAVTKSLNLIEQTKPGQIALATLLLKNPPWEKRFLADMGYLTGNDFNGRLAAVDLAASRGATIDCEAIGIAANVLIIENRPLEAKNLWRRACDRSGDLYLSDGSFEQNFEKVASSPFNWSLQPRAGLDTDIAPAPRPLDGKALRIDSSLTARTVVAQQLTALRPGRYSLSWQTARDNGLPDDSIAILVKCEGGGALETTDATAPEHETNRVATTFSVPPQGCPIQEIEIQKAASNSGDQEAGWIDNVKIAPVR